MYSEKSHSSRSTHALVIAYVALGVAITTLSYLFYLTI